MNIRKCTFLQNFVTAASVFMISNGIHAGVVASGATILSTETYIIDSTTSTLAYNPGTFSFGSNGIGSPSPTVDYIIGGSFDVTVSTIDNGNTDWLSINNVKLTANGLPNDFQIPDFTNSRLTGSIFSSLNNICTSSPNGGIASCTSTGTPIPYIFGQLNNGSVSLTAYNPVGFTFYGGGAIFQINATSVVPIPAAFWLFLTIIGLNRFSFREKKHNVNYTLSTG